MNKIKAALFVYLVRPFLKQNQQGMRDCPVCGKLLEWDSKHGWLHMADGDADCYGALSHGKGALL